MEELGTELFEIIVQIYPELAPKLTGMLMQLGEEECIACLESQEKLAERLDEAFKILDATGTKGRDPSQEEKRIDPEDGKARTLTELQALCKGTYSPQEIDAYWASMKPEKATAKAAAPKTAAAARSSPVPARSAAATAPSRPTAATPATAAAPVAAATDDVIPGFNAWLRQLKLESYSAKTTKWIEEEGACSLEEVIENLEDFADGLNLKPLERKRLVQGAEEAAAKVSQEAAVAAPAPPTAAKKTAAPREDPDDFHKEVDRDNEEIDKELEELARERKELEELEAEMNRPCNSGLSPSSAAKAKAKAPTVRVVPKAKAPTMSRDDTEWNRENELQEREYLKKQQARRAAQEAEEALEAAEEKRMEKERQAEEKHRSAAAALAAKVASSEAGNGAADDAFPALGADWQAAGKKGKKKR